MAFKFNGIIVVISGIISSGGLTSTFSGIFSTCGGCLTGIGGAGVVWMGFVFLGFFGF